MTIRATCTACGEDCTNANATYLGDIYHVGCLPVVKRRRLSDDDVEMLDRALRKSSEYLGTIK